MSDPLAPVDSYWHDLIRECTEESYRIAQEAEIFVHTQMIPQLFERESMDDRHAFFSAIDWPSLRQTAPLLWKSLAPQAMDTEEGLLARGARIQRNAQLQAMVNPPDANQVMQHLFGDPQVGTPAGALQANQDLDKLEGQQDKAVRYQFEPRTIMGLRQPNQRGFQETAAQGLENTLPMGQGG